MKKVKTSRIKASTKLFLGGATIVLVAPLTKEIFSFFLTQDCPFVWGKVECGLDKGLQNANFIMGFVALWLGIGIVVLAAGLVEYFSAKKSRLQ